MRQHHSFNISLAAVAITMLPNGANAEFEPLQQPMIGAQAQLMFGIDNPLRFTLGSTVPTPGQPLLFHLDTDELAMDTGLTSGFYLPLTGLSWSSAIGFAPLLLGIPLERGNPMFHALGGEGGVGLGWILGGAALAAGAAAAAGGGGESGGSSPTPPNTDRAAAEREARSPTGTCNGGDAVTWSAGFCHPDLPRGFSTTNPTGTSN